MLNYAGSKLCFLSIAQSDCRVKTTVLLAYVATTFRLIKTAARPASFLKRKASPFKLPFLLACKKASPVYRLRFALPGKNLPGSCQVQVPGSSRLWDPALPKPGPGGGAFLRQKLCLDALSARGKWRAGKPAAPPRNDFVKLFTPYHRDAMKKIPEGLHPLKQHGSFRDRPATSPAKKNGRHKTRKQPGTGLPAQPENGDQESRDLYLSPFNHLRFFMMILLLMLLPGFTRLTAQTIQWDKTIGGHEEDVLEGLQQTREGGYLLGGYSNSPANDDKSEDNIRRQYR
jgi:hypothetical protein